MKSRVICPKCGRLEGFVIELENGKAVLSCVECCEKCYTVSSYAIEEVKEEASEDVH